MEGMKREEFSILAKGFYCDDGFYVTDDYMIPKQKVGGASVTGGEYEEGLGKYQKDGYNVVIHSHHGMSMGFSKIDEEYINAHFPCSVLYTYDGFVNATLKFNAGDNCFLLETTRINTVIENNIEVEGMENIEKNSYVYTPPATRGSLAKGCGCGATVYNDGYNDDYFQSPEYLKWAKENGHEPYDLDKADNDMTGHGYPEEEEGLIIHIIDGVLVNDEGVDIEDKECKDCPYKQIDNCVWCYPTLRMNDEEEEIKASGEVEIKDTEDASKVDGLEKFEIDREQSEGSITVYKPKNS